MIGVRLTKDENGRLTAKLENGRFVMATDGEQAASSVTLGMHVWRDYCELSDVIDMVRNPLEGFDVYGIIFDPTKSRAEKELEIRRMVLSRPGVKRILRLLWVEDRVDGHWTAQVQCDYQTEWGNESVSETVVPL